MAELNTNRALNFITGPLIEDESSSLIEEKEEQKAPSSNRALNFITGIEQAAEPETVSPAEPVDTDEPYEPPKPASIEEASITLELIEKNPELRAAAKRFVASRLGQKDMTEEEAVEEYVEHFRKFSVNELTAASDFSYVSGIAADAAGDTKLNSKQRAEAEQNLKDYQLLYTTFDKMDSWGGGVFETLLDYGEGLLKAPSTYAGIFIPGGGKAAGLAASTAAREGVKFTLRQALTSPIIGTAAGLNYMTKKTAAGIAKRPVIAAAGIEGTAGMLQNIAEQNTELAGNLRDDFSAGEVALGFGTGAVLAGGVTAYGVKQGTRKFVERGTGDIMDKAQKAIAEKNDKALAKAEALIKKESGISVKLKALLPSINPDKNPLNPENVAKGREGWRKIAEEEGLDPELSAGLDVSTQKRLFAMGVEILKKGDVDVNTDKRFTEQVADAIRDIRVKDSDDATTKWLEKTFDKYNLTGDDFANMFMADVSDAARTLQAASRTSIVRRLTAVMDNSIFDLSAETKETLNKAADALQKGDTRSALDMLKVEDEKALLKAGERKFTDKIRRADDLRRAAMTSMTATTMRNLLSGVSRIGFDTVTRAVDLGISKSVYKLSGGKYGFNVKNMQDSNKLIGGDIFATLYGLLNDKETQAIVQVFKDGFAEKGSRLFRELQDVTSVKGVPESQKIDAMRQIAKDLNALNTASDNVMKNVSLVAGLKRGMNEEYARALRLHEQDPSKYAIPDPKNFDIRGIIERGDFNKVFNTEEGKRVLDKTIDDALYFTFQQGPRNDVSRAFINLSSSVPFVTSSLIPFPRFIANALRFTYEHSPVYLLDAGFVRFSTKNADNYTELSKAIVGTGALYGAMQFRDSEYAGEKWYHAKMPDGSNFDMRPFFPAAPYLFAADLLNKGFKIFGSESYGDPVFGDANMIQEAFQALSGTQFRAGSGLYALDKAIEDMTTAKDDPTALLTIANNFVSNAVATYTIPFTASQDFYNSFLAPDEERLVRESRRSLEPGQRIDNMLSLFLQKSLARVPGNRYLEDVVAEKLGIEPAELYQSPTSGGPLRRDAPVTRQAFGILKQKRANFFEDEIDRLKLSRRKVFAPTGVPEADNLLRENLGEYIEEFVVPSIQNDPDYESQSAAAQSKMLTDAIKEYKDSVLQSVKRTAKTAKGDADLNLKYGFNPLSKVEYKNKDKFAREYAMKVYKKRHPTWEQDGFNYDELVFYADFFQKQGPALTEEQRKAME